MISATVFFVEGQSDLAKYEGKSLGQTSDIDLDFSSIDDWFDSGCFFSSYQSSGHADKTLCASLSLLEQQFFYASKALMSSLPAEGEIDDFFIHQKDEDKGFFSLQLKKPEIFSGKELQTTLFTFLIGLDLISKTYKNDFFIRIKKCHQKKVKVHQTIIATVDQNI